MILSVMGTGTGVGKTHVAVALLLHLRARGLAAAGYKPMESGVTGERGEDELALAAAAPAAAAPLRWRAALAPPMAARLEGQAVPSAALVDALIAAAEAHPVLVLELAGGWFSPFDDDVDNAEWLAALPAALRARLRTLLVAPDRLGVLHDVSAALRAGAALGLPTTALALSAVTPERADASSGLNLDELARRPLTRAVPAARLGHAPSAELARRAELAWLVDHLLRP